MQKLVPPILFLLCLVVMFILNSIFPIDYWLKSPLNLLGILPIMIGFLSLFTTLNQYRKIRTEINTFKQPNKLITNGFFKYSRNPIYLGFTLVLLDAATLFGNVAAIIPVVFFFLLSNFWYIPFEEKNLEKFFGDSYLTYKSHVRRWI
tara:strand:+ start:295 stop:738 length:444 start_codon:yes stop_codon:yes gene_type:complete